ncbi:MAG: prolyl oligopeptidase family serine peptidase [bacterium]|nr:prolyl oligopeptidase family serine peptidase [bacterium]
MTMNRFTGPLSVLTLVFLACGSPFDKHESGRLPALDFEVLFGDNAAGRKPEKLAWAPDGLRLAFAYDDGKGLGLWTLNPDSGEQRRHVGAHDGELGELDAFHWAPDGRALLIESGGDLFLLPLEADAPDRLTATQSAEENPHFSPDGGRVAFVRDNDLWVLDLESGGERRLTEDGREGLTLNGKTDWVYWEEIWGRQQKGHWWSPDGSRIAYYRFDESLVREYPLVDFTQQYPEVTPQRYPKAGEVNPTVQVGVVELAAGSTRWLISNSEDDSYLGRVDWLPDGSGVAIQRLNRDQNRLELLTCPLRREPCKLLLEEMAKTWVNLTEDLRFLPDGRFLWTTEANGWRRLWLHGSDGTPIRELTPEGWTTEHVDELVASAESVVWTGYETQGLGALHRAVFSQSLSGEAPVAMSSEGTTAVATVARASGRTAILESRSDVPFTGKVVELSGLHLGDLPVTAPEGYDPVQLPSWTFLTIPGPEGSELPAALLEPKTTGSGDKRPVIQYHYGGPASQVVSDRWGTRGRNLWHKLMADRGYGVLMVDNSGSNYFGKLGADRLHRRFGEVNLAAQKAGFEYLRSLGWVDPDRIGLWGWSGGGSNTLYSALNSPGTWRAAVSGAPVTSWRFYDSIWTERYLDHPQDNAEGYEQSSVIHHAAKLEDALLLVHGTADDNVHPQNTFAMAAKLVAAQKPFELAIHPRQKHGFKGKDSRHFYERMTRFFDRELAD